jgi:hypothetical protein
MAIYSWNEEGSDLRRELPKQRGGEINGRNEKALTSGTRLAVRERRGELDWAGSG